MKLVKNFVLSVLFVSVLAVNAFAGEIETPGSPVPPPEHSGLVSTPETNPNDVTEPSDKTSDELIYDAITMMLSVF